MQKLPLSGMVPLALAAELWEVKVASPSRKPLVTGSGEGFDCDERDDKGTLRGAAGFTWE